MNRAKPLVHTIGSLWFAAVLLVLWAVAMACATVFESQHGTERALLTFYRSWWFELLLGLFAVNMFAAMAVRFPFTKRQIGFALTHAGILLTLGGALVTRYLGVDGQVGLAEGETANHFNVNQDSLTVTNRTDGSTISRDLTGPAFEGFVPADVEGSPVLTVGDVRVAVERFLPDSVWTKRMTNEGVVARTAIEVALSPHDHEGRWVFAGETASLGPGTVAFRELGSREELTQVVNEPVDDGAEQAKTVRVEHDGSTYDIPLDECMGNAAPIGDTGYRVNVLRYLPHALVNENKQLVNASDRAVNPAIEAEIIGPQGREMRRAFARYPDLASIHGKQQIDGFVLRLLVPESEEDEAPVAVFGEPEGEMYVRFLRDEHPPITTKVSVGAAVATPWEGREFTVLQRFDHAKLEWSAEPIEPVRETRIPAIRLRITPGETDDGVWLQKFRPREVLLGGKPYALAYGRKRLPLGFSLTLDRFRMPMYPGTHRPRSFESHVTITDPTTGDSRSRVISMNHPVAHAGYTMYQSSYDVSDDVAVSFLSVSHDPGQLVVFAGYIMTMLGMVIVLGLRLQDRARMVRHRGPGGER